MPTGTHTSLGQALLRFPGSLKRTSPCHAFPENATAGRTAPRVSPPPAGQDPPASGLLPGLFLRGGARSWPDPSRLVLTPVPWARPPGPHPTQVRCQRKRALPQPAGAGRAHTEEPARSPVPEGRPDVPHLPVGLKAAGRVPGPRSPLPAPRPPLASPAGCARQTLSYASARQRDKWLQLETGLIDTISSVIASKIR